MSIFIYVCITKFGLDVCECVCFVCFSLIFLFFFFWELAKKKKNLVKTFCKNGNVNTVLCYMLFFHGRNCTNC